MRTGFTQANAFISVTTPFGADELLLDLCQGSESISQPFQFSLSMRSASTSLAAATIIGASVTVKLALANGPTRYINGIASRFMHLGGDREFSSYYAEIVPKLWLLTLSKDRIVYQNKTAADIIKAVLDKFAVTYDAKLTATYTSREYCVQYDETAFDFISRLMEEEGIFYFFTFTNGGHKMVLGDATSAHVACTDAATLRYGPGVGGRNMVDVITRFEFESRLVSLKHTFSDYNYLTPTTALLADNSASAGKGEQYEYPGGHQVLADGTQRAKIRVEADQVESNVAHGDSYCYPLTAGTKFTLADHFRTDLNISHVVRTVTHTASNEKYTNGFEVFPATVPFRPPRVTARPRVAGSQTAFVVGPSGEEIWTDEHGRIKIQFHWDRVGKKDENSSCWVRVSQAWAGQGWGSLFLPRIGHEVVVSHVDGDPDRPIVTGSVYNKEKTTPVALPSMQTQSTIKSRSSKSGTAGNEMRLEDKKDAEEYYMHAQKDMKVEIENDLSTTLLAGSETHTVEKGDRTVTVKTGKEVHSVKTTREVTVEGNETHTNKADFKQAVTGNFELKVTGNLVIDVTGSITFKGAKDATIKAGTTLSSEAGTALSNKAGTTLSNKAGTDLSSEAGMGLKNKAGTTLDCEGAMVTVKGSATGTIDGGGMLTVKGGLVKIN